MSRENELLDPRTPEDESTPTAHDHESEATHGSHKETAPAKHTESDHPLERNTAHEPQEPAQPAQNTPQMSEAQIAKKQEQKELLDIRLQILKEELKLTDEQFEKFAPVYRNYNRAKHFSHVKCAKLDWSTATKPQINELMKARLDNTINMAMVRKNYILIFEEVITPRQVMKLYKIEDDLIVRARDEYKKRQGK